jgi:hypothetical protein
MDSNSFIIFILLFIIIGMISFLYYDNQNRELKKKINKTTSSTSINDPVEVVEYNPYIYYNPYYYDGYPWWWYGSTGGRNYYGDRRIYYEGGHQGYGGGYGGRRFYHGGHGGRRFYHGGYH